MIEAANFVDPAQRPVELRTVFNKFFFVYSTWIAKALVYLEYAHSSLSTLGQNRCCGRMKCELLCIFDRDQLSELRERAKNYLSWLKQEFKSGENNNLLSELLILITKDIIRITQRESFVNIHRRFTFSEKVWKVCLLILCSTSKWW